MLRIKTKLPLAASIDDTDYKKNQEDIKNSIKQLYIGNQSKKKTINEYAQLTTQIREEYAKLQAKCAQLENTLHKYKDYVEIDGHLLHHLAYKEKEFLKNQKYHTIIKMIMVMQVKMKKKITTNTMTMNQNQNLKEKKE